jgi:transcriptional regulator with PAS, ATPase and Fis domain
LGKDRNGKNLEKFAYDKKALNKVLKTKEPLFPKEELQQTQQKRCWVLPLIRSEEVEGLLYLDCISGSTDAIRPLILTSFTVLLYKHLQHRVFPDRSLLKAPKIGEEKTFKFSYDFIIGRSPAMCRVFEALDKISEADHLPVLILGNSGTGKELVARVIHDNSPRKGKPYIAENCAAVTETLLESELFGYVAGAFTGAEKNKKGLFDVAHNGTLFLDEVGDMSLEMQKKLLRVLQDGEIRSVGSQSSHFVNVRIIAATNRNLKQLIEKRLISRRFIFSSECLNCLSTRLM